MTTLHWEQKLTVLLKSFIFANIVLLSINVCGAHKLFLAENNPYSPRMVWSPSHWYQGVWQPGRFVQYSGRAYKEGKVLWVEGFPEQQAWNHQHWRHRTYEIL